MPYEYKKPTKPLEFIVAGKSATGSTTLEVRFPYSAEVIAEVYQADPEQIEQAAQSAANGFAITRKLTAGERARILTNLVEQMEKRTEEMVKAMVFEGGKTQDVARGETERAKETVRLSAEEAKRINGEIIPIDLTQAGAGRMGLVRKVPLGPVLGIAPFNYPVNLACHKIAPAIAAGNSFILKPASATPLSALLLGEMILEAGYPPEALSVIVAPGPSAEQLVRDKRIAFLSFTGSSQVGWHLKKQAGRMRVGLELGGNAAVIVHDDANVDYAVGRIVMGGFTNAGQNCISVQRVLVHESIYKQTLEKIRDKTKALAIGDPRDEKVVVGPMIDPQAAITAKQIVDQACEQGASIISGGETQAPCFPPQSSRTPNQRCASIETRSSLRSSLSHRIRTFAEALRLANDTDYGLQGGLFTQNMNRIMRAFDEFEVGGLQVNDVSTFRVDQMPYGGVKASGIGREGPRYAIDKMSETKLMVINLPGGLEN